MIRNRKVTAIILVAGNSTRYGKTINKNLEEINGKPVFLYSVEAFNQSRYIDNIIIAAKEEDKEDINNVIRRTLLNKDVTVVTGGNTRKESVYNCIKATRSDIVIIHDGARPAIRQEYISKCLEGMDEYRGVTVGVKSKDTIKITNDNNIVTNTTNRNNTWIIQTPQCFDRNLLLSVHERFKNDDVTDDCMLLEKNKNDIKIVEGDYTNIKITTAEDLDIIKNFI